MKALLDTHILIWWHADHDQLSRNQLKVIEAADAKTPLQVSDISLWEIATLHGLGRLHLTIPLREWLEKAVAPPLVRRHGMTPAVAAELAAFPKSYHRDPADRILVATARVLGATLLTRNRRIVEAGLVDTLGGRHSDVKSHHAITLLRYSGRVTRFMTRRSSAPGAWA